MLRKILLPALALATLAGCATGHSYRGGNGDYYYGQPGVEYRYYGDYGYGGIGNYGYGPGYYLDSFGRPVYGYPYGYYGRSYPSYPSGHNPRPSGGHGHDGDHHGDHDGPPREGDHRPGNRPPWRDIGRARDRDDEGQVRQRRFVQPEGFPQMQRPAPRVEQPSAPVMRERRDPRPVSGVENRHESGRRLPAPEFRPSAGD